MKEVAPVEGNVLFKSLLCPTPYQPGRVMKAADCHYIAPSRKDRLASVMRFSLNNSVSQWDAVSTSVTSYVKYVHYALHWLIIQLMYIPLYNNNPRQQEVLYWNWCHLPGTPCESDDWSLLVPCSFATVCVRMSLSLCHLPATPCVSDDWQLLVTVLVPYGNNVELLLSKKTSLCYQNDTWHLFHSVRRRFYWHANICC